MADPLLLDDAQLVTLTKRKRPSAQQRVLNAMGIPFKPRADGSLAVLAALVEQALGGVPEKPKTKKSAQPDWSGVNA